MTKTEENQITIAIEAIDQLRVVIDLIRISEKNELKTTTDSDSIEKLLKNKSRLFYAYHSLSDALADLRDVEFINKTK